MYIYVHTFTNGKSPKKELQTLVVIRVGLWVCDSEVTFGLELDLTKNWM